MRNRLFLGMAVTGLVLLAAAPTADSAPQTPSGFTAVASPTLPRGGVLYRVAAVSASDVWAIGQYSAGTRLVEHYDGSSWHVVASPPLPHVQLHAISAHGSAMWMVGQCHVDTGPYGCAARYTGTTWVRVGIPKQLSYSTIYNTVHVFSNTNVLIGGGNGESGYLIRWNGKTWSRVHDVSYRGEIMGIAGTLSNHLFSAGTPRRFERELPDGSWRSAVPFALGTQITAISASSAENVWVVGNFFNSTTHLWSPVAMRWNGTTETPVNAAGDPTEIDLFGVVTTRPDNTWAVGESSTGALIEHYTGGSSFADLGGANDTELFDITAVPGHESDLWVVGAGADSQPVILHHS